MHARAHTHLAVVCCRVVDIDTATGNLTYGNMVLLASTLHPHPLLLLPHPSESGRDRDSDSDSDSDRDRDRDSVNLELQTGLDMATWRP